MVNNHGPWFVTPLRRVVPLRNNLFMDYKWWLLLLMIPEMTQKTSRVCVIEPGNRRGPYQLFCRVITSRIRPCIGPHVTHRVGALYVFVSFEEASTFMKRP